MAAQQQVAECVAGRQMVIRQRLKQCLQFMRQITNRADVGQSCTAFEGVKITQQMPQQVVVVRLFNPLMQTLAGTFDQVRCFLEENLCQLRIEIL